jgi:flagellar biosynthesis protein FlhF
MIVKKYTAATETDAVLKAKEELGLGAVVLNVKTVKQRGIARIFKKNYVEITAALDEKEGQSHASENHPAVSNMSDMTVVNALTETSIEKKLDTLHNLLADQIKKNEDDKLRNDTVIHNAKEQDSDESKENGNIKYLRMVYNKLIESEVDEEVANIIIEDIDASMKKEANIDNIISAVYQKIILKLGEPEVVNTENGKTVVFFLGPTGVGKTTTIAKLASEFKLNRGIQVAMITADTYRIAAVEQLNTYAGILDVPVSVIFSPDELIDAINKYSEYDLILVDTAGRSHRNAEQLSEVKQLITATQEAGLGVNIEKYLVLSATTKYKDLLNITEAYKDIDNFRLLFTKLDETNAYGNILNIRVHTGAPLSYVTSGQAVPEDISVVNVQEMAKCLISGEVQGN